MLVLAEHHLSLQASSKDWIGILHKNFTPKALVTSIASYVEQLCDMHYGSSPDYIIQGQTDTEIPYIPVHVEYILMELMKNAMRATVEFSNKTKRLVHPPIEITIAKGEEDVTIRIRDCGGGITNKDLPRVFEYSFTTVPKYDEDDGLFSTQSRIAMQTAIGGPIAGLGFGLPMSRIYGNHFLSNVTISHI